MATDNRLLETNFSEILMQIPIFFIQEYPFESVVWKMAAILSRPQCVQTMEEDIQNLTLW